MSNTSKNKLLTGLVILLLVANAATIALFWMGKKQKTVLPKATPSEFLIKELKLDAKQQEQLEVLVKEHRQAADQLREKVKAAKDNMFDLVKQTNASDSVKHAAAAAASAITEQIDILTINHFQQVRNLCSPGQQKKFDEIIQQVTRMMARPGPPMGPGGSKGPHDGPPPPEK